MKRLFLLLALTGLMSTPIWAQDDDLYFTPSKESEEAKTTDTAPTKQLSPHITVAATEMSTNIIVVSVSAAAYKISTRSATTSLPLPLFMATIPTVCM